MLSNILLKYKQIRVLDFIKPCSKKDKIGYRFLPKTEEDRNDSRFYNIWFPEPEGYESSIVVIEIMNP